MSARYIAALDMGGTKIKGCLFEDGRLLQVSDVDAEAWRGGTHFLERGAELLSAFGPFDALGVSTAGQVDPRSGSIRYANENIPGYTGMDVRGFFEERFGKQTAVVNDVYAAALGEGAQGAARGRRDYLCLTYGTGVGGGVVLNGRLYYGAGASAGVMLGGMVIHPEAVVSGDPFSGTYERYASATALVRTAQTVDAGLVDGKAIFAQISKPAVRTVVDQWLDEVAVGLCTLVHAYNVPCVVLGGGVMEQPYAILGVRRRVEEHLIPGFRGVSILAAELGNMAGLYGAAGLASKLR